MTQATQVEAQVIENSILEGLSPDEQKVLGELMDSLNRELEFHQGKNLIEQPKREISTRIIQFQGELVYKEDPD